MVETSSYTLLRAHIYHAATRILRYGALAYVYSPHTGREYIALVADVSEKTPVPVVSQHALNQLYQQMAARGVSLQSVNQVLQQLLSPSQGLIRWHGVREAKLRVLGEIRGGRLELPEEPPRPLSVVAEPPQALLQRLLAGGSQPSPRLLPLGELAYNPGVKAYLDPERLNTHLAILGQTGSGKSETVKRLAAEYAWRKHLFSRRGGVIVMDVSGEYTGYPYPPPTGVTLLDAALDPAGFTTLQPQWLRGAYKTVLVPYDLGSISLHKTAEKDYAAEIGHLVEELRSRYVGVDVVGLLYGRHGVYRVDGARQLGEIGRSGAAALLRSREALVVVAAPLPDALTVDEVYSLSGTTSEQLYLALVEIADRVGLLDVEEVTSVSALAALVSIASEKIAEARAGQRASRQDAGQEARSTMRSFIEGLVSTAASASRLQPEVIGFLKRHTQRFIPARALINLALLPELRRSPDHEPDPALADRALAARYPVSDMEWREYLAKYAPEIVREMTGLHPGTYSSLLRAVKRVERMVSPYLDAGQYRLLAERLHEGFTLVHLAPPSRGDTSPHVARLLEELFRVASSGYQRGQRSLIVVEEAHNLAPAGAEMASKRALLRIAREGRKWGLSLVLVSQRPGFIDPDILSQAASLAALRITNPDDLAGLRRSVESTSQDLVERLPDLDPGQALLSGPAVPERRIPLLARIELLQPLAKRGQP